MIQKYHNITPEKAEIIGLLCAEGSHYNYITVYNEFFKNRGKYYTLIRNVEAVEFTNLDEKLLHHFRNLMLKVYNYAPRPTGIKTSMKIRIKKKSVIEDLVKYTEFGSKKWRIPEDIFNSSIDIKSSFIRGLFDGDGSITKYKIRLVSVNKEGICGVKDLLNSIGIECRTGGPLKVSGNRKPTYELIIPRRFILMYKNIISSNHYKKLNKLQSLR